MNALLAMQLDAMVVLMFVIMAYLFRFMLKQLSYSLHYKWQYERQIEAALIDSRTATVQPSMPDVDFQPAV